MKAYGFDTVCDLCGGHGLSRGPRNYTCGYTHIDPQTCRDNIAAQKRREQEARERQARRPIGERVSGLWRDALTDAKAGAR